MNERERLAERLCRIRRERKASDHMSDWMQTNPSPCNGCGEDARFLVAGGFFPVEPSVPVSALEILVAKHEAPDTAIFVKDLRALIREAEEEHDVEA